MEQLANVLVAQVQWLYLKRSDMPDELLGYAVANPIYKTPSVIPA